jgi:hypothetical protein
MLRQKRCTGRAMQAGIGRQGYEGTAWYSYEIRTKQAGLGRHG